MEDPRAAAPQRVSVILSVWMSFVLSLTIAGQDPESMRLNDRHISESSLKQVILRQAMSQVGRQQLSFK